MTSIGLSIGLGLSSSSKTSGPPTAPGAPTLGVLTPGNQQLSCAFALHGTGGSPILDIEYRLDGGSWTSGGVTASPLPIPGVTNGQAYDVEVRAVNAVGPSDPSNLVSGTPYTVPDAPTIDSATPGDGHATIAFTPPVDDGGDAISDYQYRVDGGSPVSAGTSSPFLISGLVNGVEVSVELRAVNAAGAGAWSTPATVTPTSGTQAWATGAWAPGVWAAGAWEGM